MQNSGLLLLGSLKLSQKIKLKVICGMQHDLGPDVVVAAGHGPGGQH